MKTCLASLATFLLATFATAIAAQGQQSFYTSPSLLPIPAANTGFAGTTYPPASEQRYPLSPQHRPVAYQQDLSSWSEQSHADNYSSPAQISLPQAETIATPDYLDPNQQFFPGSSANPYGGSNDSPFSGYEQGGYYINNPAAGAATGYPGCSSCDGSWPGDCGACCNQCCWYGGVAGLIMTRDEANPIWLSFDTANPASQTLGTGHASMEWAGGIDVRIGRRMEGGQSLEFVYWGVYPNVEEANVLGADMVGALNTAFSFQSLDYNGLGTPVVDWFDGAFRHRLRRSFAYHNVEINVAGDPGSYTYIPCCQSRVRFGWSAGFRYFMFDDGFEYASDDTDTVFTGAVDEVYYSIDVRNHLLGVQIGCQMDYCLRNRLSFYTGTKFGFYANYMEHHSFVGGSAGAAVVNDATNPFDGRAFDLNSTKEDLSFLGEIDFGLRWDMSQRWSATLGYRAVAISRVALTNNQVPFNFGGIGGVEAIDSNGALILHGGYAGLEFSY